MAPRARIVHRLPGRLRLKVPEKRRDTAWFTEIVGRLEQVSGVEQVEISPLSGSMLIRYDPNEPLEQRLRQNGLIQIENPAAPSSPVVDTLADVISRSDQALERRTGGKASLRTLLILVLVALAIVQTLRGRILTPAISLLWFAMVLAFMAKNRE